MLAGFLYSPEAGFQVTLIIQRIEYPEDVNANLSSVVYEGVYHFISVVAITDYTLPSVLHL